MNLKDGLCLAMMPESLILPIGNGPGVSDDRFGLNRIVLKVSVSLCGLFKFANLDKPVMAVLAKGFNIAADRMTGLSEDARSREGKRHV